MTSYDRSESAPSGASREQLSQVSLQVSAVKLKPRETASGEVLQQLIDHFVQAGEVRIGHKLPSERALAELFGIGRAAVRDALHTMEMLDLIEVRPGDGTYVKNSGAAVIPQLFRWTLLVRQPHLHELLESRLEVEVTMARRAATRRSDEELQDLVQSLERRPRRETQVTWRSSWTQTLTSTSGFRRWLVYPCSPTS